MQGVLEDDQKHITQFKHQQVTLFITCNSILDPAVKILNQERRCNDVRNVLRSQNGF